MSELSAKPNRSLIWVRILSVAVPLLVAALMGIREKFDLGDWVYNLPHVIAILNSLTALSLIMALVAIKKKNVALHKTMNTTALVLGAIFLLCYVTYHASANSTDFGGSETMRYVYLFFLISHILLSISVVPLVLMAFYHAWNNDFIKHKKLVKYTFPIWLYVSVSGVIVYLFISPYYQF